jgi:hypothetical protein
MSWILEVEIHQTISHSTVTRYAELYRNVDSTDVTSGAGTAYPSGAPEFTPPFSGVRVFLSVLFVECFVDRCLFLCPFSLGHCVVCPSIYGF